MNLTRGRNGLTWRTALNCNGGTCVQVAATEYAVLLGDSRQPNGPVISYTQDEWHAFIAARTNGDLEES